MLMCQSSTSTATSWMMSLVFTRRDYRGLPLGAEGNLGSFQILSEPLTYNVAEFRALTCPPPPPPPPSYPLGAVWFCWWIPPPWSAAILLNCRRVSRNSSRSSSCPLTPPTRWCGSSMWFALGLYARPGGPSWWSARQTTWRRRGG